MERKLVFTAKDVVRLRMTCRQCKVDSVWRIPAGVRQRGDEMIPKNCPHCDHAWSMASVNHADDLLKSLSTVMDVETGPPGAVVTLEVDLGDEPCV